MFIKKNVFISFFVLKMIHFELNIQIFVISSVFFHAAPKASLNTFYVSRQFILFLLVQAAD